MDIIEAKKNVVKTEIINELISMGIPPSNDIICSKTIEEFGETIPVKSMISSKDEILYSEPASSAKMNRIFRNNYIDIKTVDLFSKYVDDKIKQSYISTLSKLKALSFHILDLKREADSIKTTGENKGSFVVSENFIAKDNINEQETTCDISMGYAIAPTDSSASYNVPIDKVDVSVPTMNTKTIMYGNGRDAISQDSTYITTVEMSSFYKGSVELSVVMSIAEKSDVSNILIETDNSRKYIISVSSIVNDSILELSPYTEYIGNANISFEKVHTNSVLLKIKTDSNVNNVYSFAINNISLSTNTYYTKSVITTKPYDMPLGFSSVSLFTDENSPANTSVDYSVSWYTNKWEPFALLNANSISDIDSQNSINVFSGVTLSYSTQSLDLTKLHAYIYNNNLGTDIVKSDISNVAQLNSIIVRNIGKFRIDAVNPNLISAIIYVDSNVDIDFSSMPGFLDGVQVNNVTTVSSGMHAFAFNSGNNIQQYQSSLQSISDNNLGFFFGSHICRYMPSSDEFSILSDSAAFNKYTFVKIGVSYIAILRVNLDNIYDNTDIYAEQLLMIENSNISTVPTKLKLRAYINAFDNKSPVIKEFKLKLGN